MSNLKRLLSPRAENVGRLRSLSVREWLRVFSLSFAGLGVITLVLSLLTFGIGLVRLLRSVVSEPVVEGMGSFMVSAIPGLYLLVASLSLGAIAAVLRGIQRIIELLAVLVEDADRR